MPNAHLMCTDNRRSSHFQLFGIVPACTHEHLCMFCLNRSQYCLADHELMACLYSLANMLEINIPCTGYYTQENSTLSAGTQTSICETRLGFQERAVAQLLHFLGVDRMLFCWLWSHSLTVVTMESKCFLSPVCLLINLDKG